MLKELKFVMGAVGKKDLLPALTHFRIEQGTVRSFNGTIALCTPIQLDIDCVPKAEPLVKAIQNCDETVTLNITPNGKLSIKSGAFRALIECVEQETPHAIPEGEHFEIDGEMLLSAMEGVYPFIGNDASRPWSNGVLLMGHSAFATNNVMAVEYWCGKPFPRICNVPKAAIKEMLRIKEAPVSAQATETSITFHYEGDRWLRTQLLETAWPDIPKLLSGTSNQQPIDNRIFEALDKLKPFSDKMGRIYFKEGSISTHSEQAEGACVDIDSINFNGIYQIEMFNLMRGIATTIDLSTYPKPCLFMGKMLRGAIIGMREFNET